MRPLAFVLLLASVALAVEWQTDLDKALAQARKDGKPVAVLVADEGSAKSFDSEKKLEGVLAVRLDATKDREKAARYQPRGLPTVVFLSPRGVIVDRAEKATAEAVSKALDALGEKAKAADEELAKLETCKKGPPEENLKNEDALAEFWAKHENWAEAVPLLEDVVKQAGDLEFPPDTRLARWLELARGQAVLLRYDDAVKTAESAAKHASTQRKVEPMQKAYIFIGWCREQQEKKAEAIKAYDDAARIAPQTLAGKTAAAARDRLKQP
ncbi:MAG TPA: hypothetical protein VFF73_04980 [Planctomycetota bacterium]|nr:hypothetical protein [Planctomycetota bacterium]